MLRWDAAPGVLEWVVRVSERSDPRGGYVVREERELPADATSVEVPLGANALRVHLLGRGRGGKLRAARGDVAAHPRVVGRALAAPGERGLSRALRLNAEATARRWEALAAGARGLELAAGAVEARVDAVAGAEHADDEQRDQEGDGDHALTMPSRDYQRKS